MSAQLGNYKTYGENSASAIIRIAIVVAAADGEFDRAEYDRVERVYEEVSLWLGHDDDTISIRRHGRQLSSELADEICDVTRNGTIEEYVHQCANDITDRDVQEIAVLAALRVAGGDHHLAQREFKCLLRFCNHWEINLNEVIQPLLQNREDRPFWLPEE